MKLQLETKQQQRLFITQEIKQGLQILQLPILELEQWLSEQITQNPALEWDDPIQEQEIYTFQEKKLPKQYVRIDETFASSHETNESILMKILQQCNKTFPNQKEKAIAYTIIQNVDSKGFLSCPLTQVIEETQSNLADIETIRKKILFLEPLGIASINLQEFLLIQLEEQKKTHSLSYKILANYFDLFIHKNISLIAKNLKVSSVKMLKILRKEVKPLMRSPLKNEKKSEVVLSYPDIVIEKEEEKWKIFVNKRNIPSMKLNPLFQSFAKKDSSIRNLHSQAQAILQSIEKRSSVLSQIAHFLLKNQKPFFEEGERLKPLTLTEMAKELNIHLSTASRALKDKTLLCPYGLFPLKFFFSTSNLSGQMTQSNQAAYSLIKKWIEEENRKSPYSDECLRKLLQQNGIQCSRRTVTKYRSHLNIASAKKRKVMV